MNTFELILIALGLAMDAFAVSLCKGLSVKKVMLKHSLIAGAFFGGFQALMPLIGYFLGAQFKSLIESFDHWIVFVLLLLIGGNMIKESLGECESLDDSFTVKAMIPLALATSIDALAMGVNFAVLEADIVYAVSVIGVVTFICSALGVKLGSIFGSRFKSKAEFAGGAVLILLGIKILLEHLGVLG